MKKRTLCAILALCVVFGVLFSGCGASTSSSKDTADMATSEGSYGYVNSDESYSSGAGINPQAPSDNGEKDTANGGSDGTVTSSDSDENLAEKIIYTANVTIETTVFDDSVSSLTSLVEQYGGFVESANSSGNTSYQEDGSAVIRNRYGSYTVRIPAESFEAFLATASETNALGNVVNTSKDSQNITAQYTDYDLRLQSLNAQYDTLLTLIDKSTNIDDIITLESRISDVTYEIESIKSTLRNYDREVNYSTVNITLEEVNGYTNTVTVTSTFGERVKTAFANMGKNFKQSLQNFVVGFIYALPTLIILAVIIIIAIIVIVSIVRRNKARRGVPTGKKNRRSKRRNMAAESAENQENTTDNKTP